MLVPELKSTKTEILGDQDLEIRVNALPDYAIVQIRGSLVQGTLVLHVTMEEEELIELGQIIHDAMQKCLIENRSDTLERGC
jgi:uncharacterized protein YbcI